ncbi:MAG: hypothetical protein WBG36_00745 [Ornithinimicrobium sp.]
MRDPISYDEYQDFELNAALASEEEHRATAERLIELSRESHPDDEVSPQDLLVSAGSQLRFAGDLQRAQEVLWQAHAQGQRDGMDPRAVIVDMLLTQDDAVQAQDVSNEIRRSRPLAPMTYHYLAELWDEQGETTRALGWFMRGIMLIELEGMPDHQFTMLCVGRWRIREREGLEPDEYDEIALDFRDEMQDRVGE